MLVGSNFFSRICLKNMGLMAGKSAVKWVTREPMTSLKFDAVANIAEIAPFTTHRTYWRLRWDDNCKRFMNLLEKLRSFRVRLGLSCGISLSPKFDVMARYTGAKRRTFFAGHCAPDCARIPSPCWRRARNNLIGRFRSCLSCCSVCKLLLRRVGKGGTSGYVVFRFLEGRDGRRGGIARSSDFQT